MAEARIKRMTVTTRSSTNEYPRSLDACLDQGRRCPAIPVNGYTGQRTLTVVGAKLNANGAPVGVRPSPLGRQYGCPLCYRFEHHGRYKP